MFKKCDSVLITLHDPDRLVFPVEQYSVGDSL